MVGPTLYIYVDDTTLSESWYSTSQVSDIDYCQTRFFRVPFISRISRAWQVHENNGPRKFEYSSVSV